MPKVKAMKKNIICSVLICLFAGRMSAQENDLNVPFIELKAQKEAYFNNLVQQFGDTILTGEGSDYSEYQRWLRFWEPRLAPDGTYKDYATALKKYFSRQYFISKFSAGNTDPWLELGPFKQPNHGLTGVGGGELGVGIIHDMVFCRQNPDKMLAWSLAGGLFFTSNKGLNWVNAGSDFWARSGCNAAAFAPNNQTTWYAASNVGGSYGLNHLGTLGGIYRTTDAGMSWQLIGPAVGYNPSATAFNILSVVTKILIDPNNPALGYVATRDGLYRSNNINGNMVTWTLINSGWIEDMEFRTNNSGTLIITKNISNTWTVEATSDGYNPAPLWTIIPALTTAGHTHPYITSKLVIEVSDGAPNDVFILQRTFDNVNGYDPSHNDLYKYNFISGTVTYKSTNPSQTGGDGFCVSNFDPNIVYLAGGIQFRKSTDGGTTFGPYFTFTNTFKYHVDIDKIITPPSNCIPCTSEVYLGTHGGVSYSSDNCSTMETRSDGLAVANGDFSNSSTNPEKIALGLDHDGTVLSSGTYSGSPSLAWETVFGGDGMPPLIDYSDPDNVWVAPQLTPHYLSVTGGAANSYVQTHFTPNYGFAPFIFQNQQFPDLVYAGVKVFNGAYTCEEVFRCSNRGLGTPEKISDFFNKNLVSNPWPDNIVRDHWIFQGIYPTSKPAVMYASITTNIAPWYGKLYRNNNVLDPNNINVQNNWVEMILPGCPGASCKTSWSYFTVDATNPNIVYFGYNINFWTAPELYKADYTNPNAPVFTNIAGTLYQGGLPFDARNIITEKGSNGGIYVANDVGVFYSNNTMLDFVNLPPNNHSLWIPLGSDLVHIPLKGVEIDYLINKIRVSTAGRGVWEHDLYCPANTSLNLSGFQNISAFQEAINEITSTVTVNSNINVTYRAGTYVDLNPGFLTSPGSSHYFTAFIHPCSYPGNSPDLRLRPRDDYSNVYEYEDIDDDVEVAQVNIYPNPGGGLFTVQLIEGSGAEVRVYDAMGKQVKAYIQNDQHGILDLKGYPKGLYLVQMIVEEKTIMTRLFLE